MGKKKLHQHAKAVTLGPLHLLVSFTDPLRAVGFDCGVAIFDV